MRKFVSKIVAIYQIKMKDHIHQWKPISKPSEIIVEKNCMFVCECGAYKIQKMKEVESEK